LRSIPSRQPVDRPREPLPTIPGLVPHLANRPPGCQYQPRCARATDVCLKQPPGWTQRSGGHGVSCHHPVLGAP
jgi:oligopeptide/dipeptide ABC transporter ATP-binding protein